MRLGCPVEALPPAEAQVPGPVLHRVAIWVVGPEDGEAASRWRVSNHLEPSVARALFVGMQTWPDLTAPAAGKVVPVRREYGATMHRERACVIDAMETAFGRDVAEDVRHVLWVGMPGTPGGMVFDAFGLLLNNVKVSRKPSLGGDPISVIEAPSGRIVELHWTTIGPATGLDWGSFWEASGLTR